ncbi:MAG: 30S ribosomal protein S4 [Patescibacteria group bacterium]
MARHIGPKTRLSRRAGTQLFPKDAKIFTKRNYPPGMHTQIKRRVSGYGARMLEKQKAKWLYGILERQFRRYYEKAAKKPAETGLLILQYLETRLDNVVFRLGFAQTRPQARQLVSHGFFEVNGKKTDIPSYEVRVGDVISVKESKKAGKYIQSQKPLLSKFKPAEWLRLEAEKLFGKVVSLPTPENMESILNTQFIIEHYSR